MSGLIQVLTGCLGTLGFNILFNIRGKKLVLATLGGLISWAVFLALEPVFPSEAVRYFLSAAVITVYGELLARLEKTPTTTFLVPSIIPLIPGGALYYTMNYALNKQVVSVCPSGVLHLAAGAVFGSGHYCRDDPCKIADGFCQQTEKPQPPFPPQPEISN